MNTFKCLLVLVAACLAFLSVEARVGQLDSAEARLLEAGGKDDESKGKEVEKKLEDEINDAEAVDGDTECPKLDYVPIEKTFVGYESVTFKLIQPICDSDGTSEKIGIGATYYTTDDVKGRESKSPHECKKNDIYNCLPSGSRRKTEYMTAACTVVNGKNVAHVHFFTAAKTTTDEGTYAAPGMCKMPRNHKICTYDYDLECAQSPAEADILPESNLKGTANLPFLCGKDLSDARTRCRKGDKQYCEDDEDCPGEDKCNPFVMC